MAKDKISITVIIPAYSRAELLLKTIESVLSQVGNYSIKTIVVDDHSPQPLAPLVRKRFPKVQVIRNVTNLKSGPARNQALRFVHSDFVAFLDADDLWKPDFLATSIKNISKGNYIGSVSMSSLLFEKNMDISYKLRVYLLSAIRDLFQMFFYIFNFRKLPRESFYLIHLSDAVFKTNAIKGLSFDEKYNFGGEDWKFDLEVMDRGNLIFIPKRLVEYRYHKKSTTLIDYNLKNKWNSYIQLFGELKKRKIKGLMVWLFSKYIDAFK